MVKVVDENQGSLFYSPVGSLYARPIWHGPSELVYRLSVFIIHGAFSNAVIKVMFHSDVSDMPGLCRIDIGCTTYIYTSYKIMLTKAYFHIFYFF